MMVVNITQRFTFLSKGKGDVELVISTLQTKRIESTNFNVTKFHVPIKSFLTRSHHVQPLSDCIRWLLHTKFITYSRLTSCEISDRIFNQLWNVNDVQINEILRDLNKFKITTPYR